ncbi:MAG: alpha/beta fold hydrolase [Lysobacterales bacterium]
MFSKLSITSTTGNMAFTLPALATALLLSAPLVSAQETETVEAPAPVDLFARDSYRVDTITCPFKGDIDYDPGEIECGLLQVPENRENPDSRFIELHFVKLNSRWGRDDYDENRDEDADRHAEGLADGKREDPVIYLTGGPGAPVTYYVNRFKDHTLLDHRDLYILEQRGIGFSDNFCQFYGARNPEVANAAGFEDYLAAANQRTSDCAANARAAGVDLTGYNTIENARDVKALRRALGFEQWNVWGISYGSILGQAYMREDAEGILAIAIDAIMPLSIADSDEYWRVAKWYERDLQKLQEICDSQPACAENYPDMLGRVRAAIKSVRDNPITVDVKNTEAYPSGKAYIHTDMAGYLPFVLFYEQSNYAGLPGVIYAWADAVERRDEAIFSTLAEASAAGGLEIGGDGMRDAILCIDGDRAALERAGHLDMEQYPLLGQAIQSGASLARATALCDELGMPMRPAAEFKPIQSDLPILIIEGDMDPITPPPNARAILPGFSNGTYVEFPYAGHGPSRSVKCAGHLLNKFYDNPGAEPDLGCAESMEAPQIWAPMYTHLTLSKLGALYFEDKKKLALPAAWGGLSLVFLLIALPVLTLGPLVRWIDGRRAPDAGRARGLAWLAAAIAVAAILVLGAAAVVTYETSETLLAFGMPPWARYGAWLGVLAMVTGIFSMVSTLGARYRLKLPFGSTLGLLLTGLAATMLGSFMWAFGLGPF